MERKIFVVAISSRVSRFKDDRREDRRDRRGERGSVAWRANRGRDRGRSKLGRSNVDRGRRAEAERAAEAIAFRDTRRPSGAGPLLENRVAENEARNFTRRLGCSNVSSLTRGSTNGECYAIIAACVTREVADSSIFWFIMLLVKFEVYVIYIHTCT